MRRRHGWMLSLLVVSGLAGALPGGATAATGDPDPAFNGGNPLSLSLPTTSPPATSSSLRGIRATLDAAGRLYAGAQAQETRSGVTRTFPAIARLTAGGALDPGYGTSGFAVARGIAGATDATLLGQRLDASGRLLVAMVADGAAIAVRYTSNGVLDTTYGDSGVAVFTPAGGGVQNVVAGAIGADGAAYFVAFDPLSGGASWITHAWKLDANGLPVRAYETASATTVPRESIGKTDPVVSAVDAQGRLLLGRTVPVSTQQRATIVRFLATGARDTTYASDGQAELAMVSGATFSRITDLLVAPDDSVFAAMASTTNAVVKLSPTGATTAFGTQPFPTLGLDPKIALQDDGKLLAGAVSTASMSGSQLTLERYTTSGAADTTFGTSGGRVTSTAPVDPLGALAVTPGGRLSVVGSQGSMTIGRYLAKDPSLAPDNVTPPRVTGVPSPGQTLSCTAGTWTNTPTIQVFWDRAPRSTTSDDDPSWSQLPTVGRQYAPTATDLGSRVRCRERATNANGTVDAPAASIRVDAGIPALITAPTVAGTPVLGETLKCDGAQWSNGPDVEARWLRDGVEIPGVRTLTYRLDNDDRRHRITCQSLASNDVGAAAPAPAGNALLAVGAPPRNQTPPSETLQTTGARATDIRLTCTPGTWDEDYGAYDYRWEREGAEIAGATGPTYDATVADLGRLVRCVAFSTNPAGRSAGAPSAPQLVPLPASGEPGAIYTGGGFNRLDPVNLFAVTRAWQDRIQQLTVARRQAAADAARSACRTGADRDAPLPDFAALTRPGPGVYLSARNTCGVLLRAGADQLAYPRSSGIYWTGSGGCKLPYGGGTGTTCPSLRISVPRLNAATPPQAITSLEQAALDEVKPVQVLWDFDRDGRTDASCDPDAPILRTLPSRGIYDVRAVIVSADSAQTGIYSVSDLRYRFFPTSDSQQGALRPAQPFACKTTLLPPEEPEQPCISEATIGRTHVVGNICPIASRRIPESDLGGLPANVQRTLETQAFGAALRRAPEATLRTDVSFGLRAAPGSLPYVTTRQVDALSSIGSTVPATIAKPWEDRLKAQVPGFDIEQGQFAMDQIYAVRGGAKVNGIDVTPQNGALTMLVPSDAGRAVAGVQKMTISSAKAAVALGGIPIGSPEKLSAEVTDRLGAAVAPTLRSANLDALRADLLKRLDLGPFKLGGDAKVRMADDGTAFIDAMAQLKGPFKAGSGPIRTKVTIRASRTGKVSLEGVHLEVPKALLGAVTVSGLKLDYDGSGLSIVGSLLFPPINQGIAINRFRTTAQGDFKELDVSYLAGAGQGINIGPGIYLVKLGGGLSLDPDEIRARAGVSFGPSPGGGCPTAGVDANMNVHFGPPPFFVDARSTVQLACIPVGNAHFYADNTGLVDVTADASLDVGPIYASAALHGRLQLPSWQIDLRGRGGVRHVFSGEVKALLSNLGLAGCGRVEVFPETPFTDAVTIAGGAGIRFSGGRPPFTYAELLANLKLFTGCSLKSWSPFGRDVARAAQAGGARTFTLGKDAGKVVALEVTGAGAAPKVQVVAPGGEVLDASGFGEDLTRGPKLSGLVDPSGSRAVLFVRGTPGTWTVRPAPGSVPITGLRHAGILPEPQVSGSVGGVGASRVLRYRIAPVPGQVVRFVERSQLGLRQIRTVRRGGRGTVRYLTGEGRGTARTVVAEVVQDGLPRATITVARYAAPSPRPLRPRVRVRRRGATATLTWGRDAMARRYELTVATGRGRRFALDPAAGVRTARIGGLAKGEGAVVRVVGITPAGRRGPARVVRIAGSLRASSAPRSTRWDRPRAKLKRSRGRRA